MPPENVNEALEQLKSFSVNPYTLPADQQGWRGIGLPGARKRKWYTVLHNDQVLVTALFQLPGEQGCRHSHETGELSIAYVGDLQPIITWHPPTEAHGGLALFGLGPGVREVFSISGFDTIFTVRDDAAAALAAVR